MQKSVTYTGPLNPRNLIKTFKNKEEFIDWINLGTTEDIKACLNAFENAELYEYCRIIKNQLTLKENDN